MAQDFKIVIVGAGICGLSTAIAAHKSGADVSVLESAQTLEPLGTAISLWPNAMNCLATWGLGNKINQIGAPFDILSVRDIDGRALLRLELDALHTRHQQHSRCVTRADLHALLAENLPDEALQLGTSVANVDWNESSATVTLDDGDSIAADLIVIANGQNSTLREQVVGQGPLRPAGYGAVLGLAATPVAPPGWGTGAEACEYYGPNGRFGVFRLGPQQTYWFLVSSDIAPSTQAQPANPDWVLEKLRDWPDFTRTLVRNTPTDRMPQVAFHDRAPAPHWGNGRVLLAGDAAHPMLPNFGQGANQAIEDAYALGIGLEKGLAGAQLAKFYTKTRKRKAEALVKQNRRTGQLVQQPYGFRRLLRNTVMRVMPNWAVSAQLNTHFTVAHLPVQQPDMRPTA